MLRAGARIGGVVIHEQVGSGAMGEVYRGEQIGLSRPVAIKRIAPHLADQAEVTARFQREARLVANLQTPHVVAVYDFGRHRDDQGQEHTILIMEWVPGGRTLRHLLAAEGRLDWRLAATAMRMTAAGLAAAHAAGVSHRDVKPDNILVAPDGVAKLADFGLASSADTTAMTQQGTLIGTPNFMAPEACRGEAVGPQADMYSLGASWFQLVTGLPPFRAETTMGVLMAHCEQPAPDPRSHGVEVPASVAELITACLSKAREERPSAAGLAERIQALVAEGLDLPRDLRGAVARLGVTPEASSAVTDIAATDITPPPTESGRGASATAATRVPTSSPRETDPGSATAPTVVPTTSDQAAATVINHVPSDTTPSADDPQPTVRPMAGSQPTTPSADRRRWLAGGAVVAVLLTVGGVLLIAKIGGQPGEDIQSVTQPETGKPSARPDPAGEAAASIRRALSEGRATHALAAAEDAGERFPADPRVIDAIQDLVAADIDALIAGGRFDAARERVVEHRERWSWLPDGRYERRISLAQVDAFMAVERWADAHALIGELIEDAPADLTLRRLHVEHFGADDDLDTSRAAAYSALRIARDGGEIDERVGRTLVAGLATSRQDEDFQSGTREALLAHYREPAIALLEPWLASDDRSERAAAIDFLAVAGALPLHRELELRVETMLGRDGASRREQIAAAEWLRERSASPDWEELRARAELSPPADAPALHSWGADQSTVAAAFAELLPASAGPAALAWARGEETEEHLRWHAWQMLETLDLRDEVDPWRFHSHTLRAFDVGYTSQPFAQALEFFAGHVDGARLTEARAVLEAALDRVKEVHRLLIERGLPSHAANADHNRELIEGILDRFR